MCPAYLGPTFEEMLHPSRIDPDVRARAVKARREDPLAPINLFNVTWRNERNEVYHVVLPKALTGIEANIVVLYGADFPSGSHKVGAAYSVLAEKTLFNEVDTDRHTLVWPSTGNYGIGGAWIGGRMGYRGIVILPEEMSQERFDLIEAYGAQVIKTPGCESNVKEIYDKTWELRRADPNVRILNQFEVMGNYRFHYYVTGNTIAELAGELAAQGIGKGSVSAYVSAMGSAGTIAAGDRLKQLWPDHKIVGLEPIQCPTLYNNGYGGHDIQGIGDKHVTWIHNVMNMDAIMCIDDIETKRVLQVFAEEAGRETLVKRFGLDEELVEKLGRILGISSICNIIGAIKTAKYYAMGADDVIVTIATDGMDRYHSVMADMARKYGPMDEAEATAAIRGLLQWQKTDWIKRGTPENRRQWHNLKYYTWVEQQGKTVEELNVQLSQQWWIDHQQLVGEIDSRLLAWRKEHPVV
ncbi:MAG: pyridoxal-phosphate dependent enzyme [Anaerolineae bacterium]|nr:pyridoxal-phosphate dependent enzyme [Anaerolineae bacterium]